MEKHILTPHEIRERLKQRHGKAFNSFVASKAGKSGAWVSRHINGTLKTREGRKLIARYCGVKIEQIKG